MKFTPNWYNEGPVVDVPTFQELDDITATAFDNAGNYIGPKEKPDMQLVVDNTSGRKFFARKEYDDDSVKYAMAKFDEAFNPEEWWGMQNDPVLSTFENVSVAGINGVKMALRAIATVPTKVVSGGVGLMNFISQVDPRFKNTEDRTAKAIKSQSMALDNLYRSSAKNWEQTLDKWGLKPAEENIAANSVLVQVGNMVGQTVASLLTAAAFSSVGGLPAVAAVFGTQQYQEIREEYLQKGFTFEQANTFALLAGLSEGSLEAVGFKYFKRFATMNKSINNSLIASTSEALQEASQTLSESTITNVTGLRADDFKSIMLDVLISAVAGGVVGAAGSIVTGQAEQRIEKIVETAEEITKPVKALPAPKTGMTIEQEIAQAKKTKTNKLYNIVRAIGQEEKLDDKAIDFIYKVAKKELDKGTTPQMLLEGVGKQIVAYKDALEKGKLQNNPEVKEAAEKIQYALSHQSVDDFRNKRKAELDRMGLDEETANAVAQQTTDIYQTLSNQLGIDVNELRPVEVEFAPTTAKTEQTHAQQYKTFREVVDRINEIDTALENLDKGAKAPKTTLLSVLRRTGVDYSQTTLDPAVLRDLRIKNKSVKAGGLGAESLDYLRRHNFMDEVETATYEDLAQQTQKADQMLMDTLAGKLVYSLDKGTQLQEAEQVEFAKYQLQQERDELVQDAARGQIRFEDTLDRIILGKYADASTMLHELMHHWENVIEIAAAKGNKRAIQLKEAKDKIINENWRKTKQDVNQRLEVLSEAYEKWLYMGAKSKSTKRQGLFNSIRNYMQKVYDSAKAITGIRIDQNIDAFFKEITGEKSEIPTNLYQTGIDYKNGKADTNSAAFKKWFGNSKVVDENGKPLVVYHGSEADFDVFDRTKTRANMDIQGNFFSPWELDAQGYGRNVRAFYLSIKNPAPEAVAYAALKKYQGQNNAGIKAREELERMGYDGVNNSNEEYIAFYPEQIKSVYNRGTFDPENPNILYQTVRAQKTGERAADERPSDEQIEKDLAAIKNNGIEKYQPKGRFANSLSEFTKDIILTIRQRAGAIDPKLKAFFDKLDYWEANMERAFAQQTEGWLKKYKALSEAEKNEFDYYVYNHLTDRLAAFVKQKGMEKEYAQVRKTLDFVYQIANQAGIDMGFIGEYFPTSIKDYGAFMDELRGTDKWTYVEKALRELDPKGTMSEAERADAVNKIIRGYHRLDPVSKPASAKERKILYKNPQFMRYYEHSDMALIKYMSSMTQAFAINRAFGKGKGFNTEETIGQIVLDLVEIGTITRAEETEIKKLLKSRLSFSSTPAFISLIKNMGYMQMMNNITSGITQLGDLSASIYKYGFGNTMKALFGKKNITKKDMGLERIAEEYMDRSKAGVAVDKLFKVVGLNAFDSLGKTTAINAGLLKLRKQAQKGDLELAERLAYTFGSQASKVLTDIKNGNITEDVKIMLWAELADTQPIGKSGMPKAYWDNPRGRLFYQLKTYTTNQLSLYYADGLLNISRGIQYKNKDMFLKGVGNLFRLAMLLTAGNATMDVLKNLLMGRHIDVSDVVVSNLLWNVGVSKYIFYKGKREGYARALLSSFLLPPQTGIFDDVQLDIRRIAIGKKKWKDTYLVNYLPFGRSYYWWFGGGRTQEKKDRIKRRKKKD